MTEPRLRWSQLPAAPLNPINQTESHCWQKYTSRTTLSGTLSTFLWYTEMDSHCGATVVQGAAQTMETSVEQSCVNILKGTFKEDDPAPKDLQAATFNSLQSIVWMSFFFFQTSNNPCCARGWQYGGSCGVTPLTRYYQCCTFNCVQYSATIVKLCLNGP